MAANTVRDVVLLQNHQNASENMFVLGAHPPRMPSLDIVRAIKHRAVPLSQVSPDLVGEVDTMAMANLQTLGWKALLFPEKARSFAIIKPDDHLAGMVMRCNHTISTLTCSSPRFYQACKLMGTCQNYS